MQKISNSRGVVNSRKFFYGIGVVAGQRPTSSVASLPAQATRLCDSCTSELISEQSILHSLNAIMSISPILHAFAIVQMQNGLRVSEMLNIRGIDLMTGDRVVINGLKGSLDRIIVSSLLCAKFKHLRGKKIRLFRDYDRYYLYRLYKKVGLTASVKSSSKKAVTHVFRHKMAKDLKRHGVKTEVTKSFIGHKNIKNTQRYGG